MYQYQIISNGTFLSKNNHSVDLASKCHTADLVSNQYIADLVSNYVINGSFYFINQSAIASKLNHKS